MNLLAFDTGTEMMSIAVARTVDGRVQQWQHTSAGGAQASTSLIATILDLMRQADLRLDALDAICFGCGPGSFTGLRTACSVAQGLAFGACVPVLPVDSLLAVAEDARFASLGTPPRGQITALLDARMDEIYAATYAFEGDQWTELQASRLVRPEALSPIDPAQSATDAPWVMAGNVFAVYGERVAAKAPGAALALRLSALPTATAMLRLAPQLLAAGKAVSAEHALPSYIRDKVAKTTQERATEKAAALAALAAVTGLIMRDQKLAVEVRFEPLLAPRLDEVVRVEQCAYAQPWSRANFLDALHSGYQAEILMADETILGYFVAMKGVDEVHLLNITVAPEYQGQGWARVMLDALTLWSRGQSAQWLWLEVRVGNARAMQVYESHGYRRVGQRKDYYPAGHGQREDAVVMSLQL